MELGRRRRAAGGAGGVGPALSALSPGRSAGGGSDGGFAAALGPVGAGGGVRAATKLELLDGFKRLAAARQVAGLTSLSVRVLEVDERDGEGGDPGAEPRPACRRASWRKRGSCRRWCVTTG